MSIKQISTCAVKHVINMLGYDIYKFSKPVLNRDKYSINIGSGNWECPGWINLDYPSEWYVAAQAQHKFIPYNIRNDKLPFDNDTVGEIYCSHVIEHIENKYIAALFNECHRVLARGGVFRIACPDAEFLYQVTKLGKKEYWSWLRSWFEDIGINFEQIRAEDCLISEIANPKFASKDYHIGISYQEEFDNLTMIEFLEFLTSDLKYDEEHVGDHINYWTYEKLKTYLSEVGFSTIIRSKYLGSTSYNMQNRKYFDRTHPEMTLYVEAIK